MNTLSDALDTLREAVTHPTQGVVGLVDDTLRLCQEHGLQLDWRPDAWRVRSVAGGPEEMIAPPARPSVFRAVLARIAALCNERDPNSVSPYGGQGTLSVGHGEAVFQVAFANTPDEQWLTMRPLAAR